MPLTLRIRNVTTATGRSCIVQLALEGRRFPYRAGQAIMVGTHGAGVLKPYSLAAAPRQTEQEDALELLVGVDGSGNAGPHLTLEPRSLVDVEGPLGGFGIPEQTAAQRFCFVAGGTGIAPLRAMLHEVLDLPGRDIGVLYSARTPTDFAYAGELQYLARCGRIQLRRTVTRDAAADEWDGDRGRITSEHLASFLNGHPTMFFVCGPPALVRGVMELLSTLDVPEDHVHTEKWLRPAAAVRAATLCSPTP